MPLQRAGLLKGDSKDHMDCFRYAVLNLNLSQLLPQSAAGRPIGW